MSDSIENQSRRSFMGKAAYIAPAVLTLTALPAFASQGSGKADKDKEKKEKK